MFMTVWKTYDFIIESDYKVFIRICLFAKEHANCFGWVNVDLPSFGPQTDFIQIGINSYGQFLIVFARPKNASIVCKEEDIRLYIYSDIVNVYQEEQGSKDASLWDSSINEPSTRRFTINRYFMTSVW